LTRFGADVFAGKLRPGTATTINPSVTMALQSISNSVIKNPDTLHEDFDIILLDKSTFSRSP
jgi:hypothetical protein